MEEVIVVHVSRNKNITTPSIIQSNPEKPWNWRVLSLNPNITIDIIKYNLDKPWDWDILLNNNFENDPYFTSNSYIKRK
jgi:hypothetical protein